MGDVQARGGSSGPDAELAAGIATQLAPRLPELAGTVADRVLAADPYWADGALTREEIRDTLLELYLIDVELLSGALSEDAAARRSQQADDALTGRGANWARRDVPLPVLLDGNRLGLLGLWEAVAGIAVAQGADGRAVAWLSGRLTDTATRRFRALRTGRSAEATALAVGRASRREALVEALLTGVPLPSLSLWEVADHLGLPRTASYVVAVADTREVAQPVLDDGERRLRAAGYASAWRLAPDTQTGIVALDGGTEPAALLTVLRDIAPCPLGVSVVFTDLGDAAQARELARIALLAAASDPDCGGVLAFEENPLAVTAVASPAVNSRIAREVLRPLLALDEQQRATLIDTLWAWIDHDGSGARAAESLYVHRNTVHQRLAKLQQLTGRSLSSPRDVAELCVALSTMRSLG